MGAVALRRRRGVGAVVGREVTPGERGPEVFAEAAVEGGWKVKARVEGEKG
jgi:hypothetical protein